MVFALYPAGGMGLFPAAVYAKHDVFRKLVENRQIMYGNQLRTLSESTLSLTNGMDQGTLPAVSPDKIEIITA
jgi:hypothetical protein